MLFEKFNRRYYQFLIFETEFAMLPFEFVKDLPLIVFLIIHIKKFTFFFKKIKSKLWKKNSKQKFYTQIFIQKP